MLQQLLASRPARSIRSRSVAASAAAHVALITAVLATTRGGNSHSHAWNQLRQATPRVTQVRYLTTMPTDEAAPRRASNATEKRPTRARRSSARERQSDGVPTRLASLKESLDAITDRLAEIHPALDVADVTRALDADEARWTAVADSEFNKGRGKLSDGLASPPPVATNGIYTPDLVDEQVTPRPGNPKPRYPESLRAAGVEAAVNVLFVVDTTGRVEEPSIKFSSHIHELFMDAIRVSLRRARFFPARLAGSVVPQMVQQQFRFELRDR
jgi:TonB family protein